MSERFDRPHGRDAVDADVRAAYRALPDDEVPEELDAGVFAEAEAAVSNSRSRAWMRWSAPLAVAASMLVVVVVLLDTGAREQALPTSADFSPPAAPRPVMTDTAEIEVAPAAKEEQATALRARQEQQRQSQRMMAPAPPPAPDAPEEVVVQSARRNDSAQTDVPMPVIVETQVQSRALNLEGLEEMAGPPRLDEVPAAATRGARPDANAQRPASASEPVVVTGAPSGEEAEVEERLGDGVTNELRHELEAIHAHRQAGRNRLASRAIRDLRARYPKLDIEAELKVIAEEAAQ